MSANAEARWVLKLYKEGKITAEELDDAERDAMYEAEQDAWEAEQDIYREETEQWESEYWF